MASINYLAYLYDADGHAFTEIDAKVYFTDTLVNGDVEIEVDAITAPDVLGNGEIVFSADADSVLVRHAFFNMKEHLEQCDDFYIAACEEVGGNYAFPNGCAPNNPEVYAVRAQ